jgi:hypothetical protein
LKYSRIGNEASAPLQPALKIGWSGRWAASWSMWRYVSCVPFWVVWRLVWVVCCPCWQFWRW